jgi:hypothetical protein
MERKGGISINICKGDGGGKRVALLKYAFRLISVAGNCSKYYFLIRNNSIKRAKD